MKIAIILPSSQYGLDGMADYSLQVAGVWRRAGHEVLVYGVNDFHPTAREFEELRPDGVKVLNLPSWVPIEQRVARIAAVFKDFPPDHVSVQFLWWGFWWGRKMFPLARAIRQATPGASRSVMYHETIAEMSKSSSIIWIFRVLFEIAVFHRLVGGGRSFTNTPRHRTHLRWLGIFPKLLPVPSNILRLPVDAEGLQAAWRTTATALAGSTVDGMAERGGPAAELDRGKVLLALVFGRIRPGLDYTGLVPPLRRRATATGRSRIAVVSLGAVGYDDVGMKELQAFCTAQGLGFAKLGRREAEEVSQLMSSADLGISLTEPAFLGKSSTHSALVQHGLPVLVPSGRKGSDYTLIEADLSDAAEADGSSEWSRIAGCFLGTR